MAVNDRCHVSRDQRRSHRRSGPAGDRSVWESSPAVARYHFVLRRVIFCERSCQDQTIPSGGMNRTGLHSAATWQHTPQPPGPRTQRREPHTWNVKEGQVVKVGVPKEVKNHEYRVAITPSGVHEFVRSGHEVLIEQGAGEGSLIPDTEFVAAGARIAPTADDVWADAGLVLKVKEPVAEEYHRMRKGQILFTYLHLAASRACTKAMLDSGVTGIAYETVQTPNGALPLLAPMSEVAGRLAPQVGAYHLMRSQGGRGVLMGGVSGVRAAHVVVIGAGVSGMNAAAIALGMQAEVLLLDKNIDKLRQA